MLAPTLAFEGLVLGKKIRHGGHPVLRWNLANIAFKTNPDGNKKPYKAKIIDVDLRTIQELGRWASLSMVQRYSSLSKTHKAEAIEKLSNNSPAIFTTSAAETQHDTQLKMAINA